MKALQKAVRIAFHTAEWCLIAAAAALVVLMLFGMFPYAVRTGSMEPEISVGSICFVNRRVPYEEVHEGDIIAFRVGEMLVTHRAVSLDADGITTKGDANNTEDSVKITREDYIGRTVFWIPYLGELLFARTRRGKIICVCALLLFLLAGWLEERFRR